ncbi:MAG: hypothetical protein EPO28_09250 [Saprospiraceae bacterium]|nr:MAG: hypothetical protein EPO28_09250 [Saprospiraceae bacterium]
MACPLTLFPNTPDYLCKKSTNFKTTTMVTETLTSSTSKTVATKTAQINNQPFAIVPGETILSFVRRYKGKDAVPTLSTASPAKHHV